MELLMGNWDGFDMQAELHPGFVPDACAAEVPGRPTGPMQVYDAAALLRYVFSDCLVPNVQYVLTDRFGGCWAAHCHCFEAQMLKNMLCHSAQDFANLPKAPAILPRPKTFCQAHWGQCRGFALFKVSGSRPT